MPSADRRTSTEETTKAADVIQAYDDLMRKALTIVYFSEPDYARLALLENDEAIVFYPRSESCYDSCSIEQDKSRTFPAALLDASDADVAAWKVERARLDKIAGEHWQANRKKHIEEEERRTLAALKAKYGA
jgi:hypothetical protein